MVGVVVVGPACVCGSRFVSQETNLSLVKCKEIIIQGFRGQSDRFNDACVAFHKEAIPSESSCLPLLPPLTLTYDAPGAGGPRFGD